MKKLYRVDMMVMVMAEDEDEAINVATGWGIEIAPDDCDATEGSSGYPYGWEDSYPYEWEDSIPFGSDDDRTCKEILEDERTNV